MTDQTTVPPPSRQRQMPFFFLSCYLIANAALRVFTTAHEYPMRSEQVLIMAFDALAMLGLFGVRNNGPKWLFWLGIACGVLLFVIRLNGDASWWTGHLTYALPPR